MDPFTRQGPRPLHVETGQGSTKPLDTTILGPARGPGVTDGRAWRLPRRLCVWLGTEREEVGALKCVGQWDTWKAQEGAGDYALV